MSYGIRSDPFLENLFVYKSNLSEKEYVALLTYGLLTYMSVQLFPTKVLMQYVSLSPKPMYTVITKEQAGFNWP